MSVVNYVCLCRHLTTVDFLFGSAKVLSIVRSEM